MDIDLLPLKSSRGENKRTNPSLELILENWMRFDLIRLSDAATKFDLNLLQALEELRKPFLVFLHLVSVRSPDE